MMGDRRIIVRANNEIGPIRVIIGMEIIGGELKLGKIEDGKITFHPHRKGAEVINPTLLIEPEVARELVGALQKCGIRPPEQSFIEGKLVATEEHLKDMRKLVFEEKAEITNKT